MDEQISVFSSRMLLQLSRWHLIANIASSSLAVSAGAGAAAGACARAANGVREDSGSGSDTVGRGGVMMADGNGGVVAAGAPTSAGGQSSGPVKDTLDVGAHVEHMDALGLANAAASKAERGAVE